MRTFLILLAVCTTANAQTRASTPAQMRAQVRPPMPNVVGLTLDSARAVLTPLGVEPKFVTPRGLGTPSGLVARQFPLVGEALRPDSTVLTVGRTRLPAGALADRPIAADPGTGPNTTVRTTTVPDLAPFDSTRWREVLKGALLSLSEIRREQSTEKAAGQVLRTDPETGRSVPVSTPVAVYVSLGPPPPPPETTTTPPVIDTLRDTSVVTIPARIMMPPVTGFTAQQALRTLDSAGLVSIALTGSTAPGSTVEAQRPIPGDSVLPGTPVTLVMVTPVQRTVPSLLQLSLDAATDRAAALGFTVTLGRTVRAWRFNTVVESQAPSAGPMAPDQPNAILVTLVAPYAPPLVIFATVLALGAALGASINPPKPVVPPPAAVTARAKVHAPPSVELARDGAQLVQTTISVRFTSTLQAPGIYCTEESVLRIARWSDEQ